MLLLLLNTGEGKHGWTVSAVTTGAGDPVPGITGDDWSVRYNKISCY